MTKIKKQYGLWTGIAMVVGIVIGSGVFVKAEKVLTVSGGDLKLSLLAWLVGGLIMVASGFCFAVYAAKVQKYNGVVDYVETATNKRVGYHLAWVFTTFYYPIIAAIVAILAAQNFFAMFGLSLGMDDYRIYVFALIVLTLAVVMNYASPMLSSKFQISATIIKLIPIAIVAFVGLFGSIIVGPEVGIVNAFTKPAEGYVSNFGDAVKVTSFAYEGWVCATAINAELKESKKNLPRALVGGTIAVLAFYLIYYIALSSFLGNAGTIEQGSNAPVYVFSEIMGSYGSFLMSFFIMISCLGTVNGVTISCCRGMYTMSCRGQGIMPEKFSKIGKNQSVSLLSCIYGYCCILIMLLVWYLGFKGVWIFPKLLAMDEIVCSIIYAVYITMYISIICKFKEENVFRRFIMPVIAIIGALFFMFCGTGLYTLVFKNDISGLEQFGIFMILFTILTIPSFFFYKKDRGTELTVE